MRFLSRLGVVLILILAAGLWVTRPKSIDGEAFAALAPDPQNGAVVFAATGCASCHKPAEGESEVLSGGRSFKTQFGTFYAPNITPHATAGIGSWTDAELANAIVHGTLPGGQHAYPSLPYTSYNKARLQDVADLIAHLRSLPEDDTVSRPHDLSFPFNVRLTLGGWKLLFESTDWVLTDVSDPQLERGRYLVEALGHCAECHTPRNALGGLDRSAWLMGADNPSGEGKIPGIHPAVLDWSEVDIAAYLNSGFTPEFDVAGGEMVDVIENTSKLSDADRAAMAAYIKALP